MIQTIEQALGALIIVVALADIFLTILYARAGTQIFSFRLATAVLSLFKFLARWIPNRDGILSFCGPVILVVVFASWALLLTLGGALIILPGLGSGVVANQGQTPTDFITAWYASAESMSIVGSGGLSPASSGNRLFFMFTSFIGLSVSSLTLSYIVQVYSALLKRNSFAIKLDMFTNQSGNGAAAITKMGRGGDFRSNYSHFVNLGENLADLKETYHVYPVLFYFNFPDSKYGVSRILFVVRDMIALIKTGLSDRYEDLKMSVAVDQLQQASELLTDMLETSFHTSGFMNPVQLDQGRWIDHFHKSLEQFRKVGIETAFDEEAATRAYVQEREKWVPRVDEIASTLGYTAREADPALLT